MRVHLERLVRFGAAYAQLSTRYHLVANNGSGSITDFLQDINALIARELNAFRRNEMGKRSGCGVQRAASEHGRCAAVQWPDANWE